MLFRYSLDMPEAADNGDRAVNKVLAEGHRTDIAGSAEMRPGLSHHGQLVIENL